MPKGCPSICPQGSFLIVSGFRPNDATNLLSAVTSPLDRLLPPTPTSLAGLLALSNLAGCQSFFCALSAILRAASLIAPLALPTAF